MINNNQLPVDYSRRLLGHISTHSMLSSIHVQKFSTSTIRSPVAGFCITDYPLWKLGCLLDENWLEEDVLNSLLELLYFHLAAVSMNSEPTALFLPIHFFANATYLHSQSPQKYGPNILALRSHLCATMKPTISFVTCIANHFSGYRSVSDRCLEHGDSMAFPPVPELLPIIQWAFRDLDLAHGIPTKVIDAPVCKQGPASGSCGVSAKNFVESGTDPLVPPWPCTSSSAFRTKALRDLLVYHLTAIGKGVSTIG